MERSRLSYVTLVVFFALLQSVIVRIALSQERDSISHLPRSIGLDDQLFFDLNRGSASQTTDGVMKFASGSLLPLTIAIPTSMIVGGLAQSNNSTGWTTASNGVSIAAGIAVTLALQELVIKPLVRRERPYKALDSVRWVDSSATGYSFPSSHAATSWGLAVGLSLRYPKWYVIGPSVAYALVVSLSRPYLGVHFPSDVLTGAILGSLVQYAFYKFQYWPKTPRSSTGAYFSSAAVRGPIGLGIALPLGN